MFNTAKRALAIMLALAMVFALVGCNQPTDDGSSVIVEYVDDIVYVDGDTDGDDDGDGANTQNPSGNSTTNKDNDSTTTTTDGPVNVNPADLKGTKIIFESTVDPADDGTDYVVKKFEEKYGIEVQVRVPTLENYNAEMVAYITSGAAPTVGRSNGDAPIYVGYFDSLDKAQLNFDDPLWNQNTFKLSTYNGKPYLCDTMGNFWTEIDMVVYSKSILKKAGVPEPWELDEQGKWTLDSYIMIGKETAKVDGCGGASYGSYDTLLHMSGGAVYRPDSKNMMKNGIDSETINIAKKISQAVAVDKSLVSGGPTKLITNEVSMSTTHLWTLRTDGNLKTHPNKNDLGFYYLPVRKEGEKAATDSVVTGLFRGWGIMKGCNENPATGPKSAAAGGLFLSEYLNVNNYNLKTSFISKDAETFFFQLCELYAKTNNYNPYYTTYKLNSGISGMDDDKVVYSAFSGQPAQVETTLMAAKKQVDNACDNLNDYITKQVYGR